MPRTPIQALGFLFGFWLVLSLLTPLHARAEGELEQLEAELHRAVNEFRTGEHLIALERRAELDAVARAHSEDMLKRDFFAHETPEGWNWVDRLGRAGIAGFAMAGENVGQTSQQPPNERILTGWKNSPAHRENLVARPYNATGIGIARHPDGRLYYTQLYLNFPR